MWNWDGDHCSVLAPPMNHALPKVPVTLIAFEVERKYLDTELLHCYVTAVITELVAQNLHHML